MRPALLAGTSSVRAATAAMVLALAGAGCQAGARPAGPGSGVPTSALAPAVPVPAPAGGQTYAAFCGATPGCPSGGVPAALRRPMHLPHLAAGSRCPVSGPGRKVYRYEAKAIGPGPVYLNGLAIFGNTGVLPFVLPGPVMFADSAWGGQVLKWMEAPSYHGPLLIRGRVLTGRDGLGFGDRGVPLAEMDVPPGSPGGVGLNSGGWRLWAGCARLLSPGCYGVQVDATTFSEIIIFRACLSSSPRQQTGRCRSW